MKCKRIYKGQTVKTPGWGVKGKYLGKVKGQYVVKTKFHGKNLEIRSRNSPKPVSLTCQRKRPRR